MSKAKASRLPPPPRLNKTEREDASKQTENLLASCPPDESADLVCASDAPAYSRSEYEIFEGQTSVPGGSESDEESLENATTLLKPGVLEIETAETSESFESTFDRFCRGFCRCLCGDDHFDHDHGTAYHQSES